MKMIVLAGNGDFRYATFPNVVASGWLDALFKEEGMMHEARTRAVVEAHAQAVVDPIDVAQIQADMIEELHPSLEQIAGMLPQPVTQAVVDSLDVQDDHALAIIRYSGSDASLVIRSRWEDRGAGRPQIVSAEPEA